LHLLFGEARDLQFLEAVDMEEVSSRLERACDEVDALHLALILLDESLSHDTRRTAAEELEELQEIEENRCFVLNILHAYPLPAGADPVGAIAACPERANLTRHLLERLGSLQGVITEVYSAWKQIPEDLFEKKGDRTYTQSIAVREGFFRDLVVLLEAESSLDGFLSRSVANKAFQGVHNLGDILRAWLVPLRLKERAQSRRIEVNLGYSTILEDAEVHWPFPKNLSFAGRESELAELREALLGRKLRSVAIVGVGGMGKTTLAKHVADAISSEYPGGVQGLYCHALRADEFEDKLDRVRGEAYQRPGRKLWIIDGAEAVSVRRLSEVLTSAYLQDTNSQVLLTSRLHLPNIQFTLELGPLSEEGAAIIWEQDHVDLDKQSRERLYALSQGHPFTAVLLGQLVRDQQLGLDDIAKYFRDFESATVLDAAGRPIGKETAHESRLITSFASINDELFRRLTANPDLMYQLEPRQFEELVAELFYRKGYDVELTRASKDGGKDLYIAKRSDIGTLLFVVECKKYAPDRPVGVELVRHLYGVVEAERVTGGILATTSRFTRDAKAFQESFRSRLNLKDYINLQKLLREAIRS
jgi:restriction system protein